MSRAAKAVTKPPIDIITACHDPDIFGPWFKVRATWSAWFTLLKVIFGLPLDADELATFQKHTGRSTSDPQGYFDATLVIGRRGGKSLILALIAAYFAAFYDWRRFLTGGERATIMIIAADRRQAGVIFKYLREMLDIPLLQGLIQRETNELLELSNDVTIEIATASFRTLRGRTIVLALCDELAFWVTDSGANPDSEIVAALKPAMATIPNARLLKASSPYARRGVLWNDFRKHYGVEDSRTLVWKAATRDMNPSVPQSFVDASIEEDAAHAAAELFAEFRTDVESFVSREAVDACVIEGRHELPRARGFYHEGFVDCSGGGGSDSMAIAIAHREGDKAIVDAIREARPPFSPEQVVADFSALLKAYRIDVIIGDKWAGTWPAERFATHRITYRPSARPKSDLYRDFLPILNGRRVELLDHPKLVAQVCSLERRTARGGRDSIDSPPNAHEDIANVVAGVVTGLIVEQYIAEIVPWHELYGGEIDPERNYDEAEEAAARGELRGHQLRWLVAERERRAKREAAR
jgi:hypothetical protein